MGPGYLPLALCIMYNGFIDIPESAVFGVIGIQYGFVFSTFHMDAIILKRPERIEIENEKIAFPAECQHLITLVFEVQIAMLLCKKVFLFKETDHIPVKISKEMVF